MPFKGGPARNVAILYTMVSYLFKLLVSVGVESS